MGKRKEKHLGNRIFWCNIRLTEDENRMLKSALSLTTFSKTSEYVRHLLFNKAITIKHRNQSLDDLMNIILLYRTELNYLGNNFNQVVKKINSTLDLEEQRIYLPAATNMQKQLLLKIDEVQDYITKLADKWLQTSEAETALSTH